MHEIVEVIDCWRASGGSDLHVIETTNPPSQSLMKHSDSIGSTVQFNKRGADTQYGNLGILLDLLLHFWLTVRTIYSFTYI